MAENLKASVCWVSFASIHAKPAKQKGPTPADDANSLIGTPVTMENHRHCPVGVEERKSQEEVPLESLVKTDTNKSTDEMEGCVTKMKPVFVWKRYCHGLKRAGRINLEVKFTKFII